MKWFTLNISSASLMLWPSILLSTKRLSLRFELNAVKKFWMLVCFYSHSFSSCDNVLSLIRFHLSYGSGTPCCSEMCNLSAVILQAITFYIPLQQPASRPGAVRLIKFLRLIKFQRYLAQGYEIVCSWLDATKLKTQTLEITSVKCMWCLIAYSRV